MASLSRPEAKHLEAAIKKLKSKACPFCDGTKWKAAEKWVMFPPGGIELAPGAQSILVKELIVQACDSCGFCRVLDVP